MSTNKKLFIRHPGFYLKEILDELGISQYRFGVATGIPHSRVTAIVKGTRSVTVETAMRIGRFFNQSPQTWINLQNNYDVYLARKEIAGEIEKIVPFDFSTAGVGEAVFA